MNYPTSLFFGNPRKRPAPVMLARSIAQDIIASDLPAGQRLGAWPAVAERYGVSVPTLRKAITILQEDGIVLSQEGRSGGLMVAAPPAATAVQSMYLFLKAVGVSQDQIDEARRSIDVALAERACRMVEEGDLAAAVDFNWSVGDGRSAEETLYRFDAVLLHAAHQPVLTLFSSVLDLLESEFTDTPLNVDSERCVREAFIQAIAAGDLIAAIDAKRRMRTPPPQVPSAKRLGRLADPVVKAIKSLIAERSLQAGDGIGTEAQLQHLLGVGRVTLRDALRPLERSGLIRIAKGRNGGIFVGSAEPYDAIEMISLYLSSINLTFPEQIESRIIIETVAAACAAERITPELYFELEAAAAEDRAAAEVFAPDWDQKGATVERMIARASGNPLLEFFTLALVELSMVQARASTDLTGEARGELMRLVSHHHGVIVSRIGSRCPARAAFATRQYLRALDAWIAQAEEERQGAPRLPRA